MKENNKSNPANELRVSMDAGSKLRIETPSGQVVVLDDELAMITITDSFKNKLLMERDGISIESVGNLRLAAKGQIEVEGDSGITLDTKRDFSVDSTNAHINAKSAASVCGKASAEFSATGKTTVKGAMVMIN